MRPPMLGKSNAAVPRFLDHVKWDGDTACSSGVPSDIGWAKLIACLLASG
jgi:hypothetical protein